MFCFTEFEESDYDDQSLGRTGMLYLSSHNFYSIKIMSSTVLKASNRSTFANYITTLLITEIWTQEIIFQILLLLLLLSAPI